MNYKRFSKLSETCVIVPYLVVIRRQLIKALLNYMISVEVLNQNDDVKAERNDDGMDLGGAVGVGLTERLASNRKKSIGKSNLSASGQEINHLLNSTSSMHVQRNIDEIRGNGITDEVALFIRRILKQLLAKIITEGVGHQIGKVGKGLAEDNVSMFRDPLLQLLLEITATVLILAQAGNFTNEIFEAGAGKTIN